MVTNDYASLIFTQQEKHSSVKDAKKNVEKTSKESPFIRLPSAKLSPPFFVVALFVASRNRTQHHHTIGHNFCFYTFPITIVLYLFRKKKHLRNPK